MQNRGPGRPSLGDRWRTTLRLDEEVAAGVRTCAGKLGMSMNEFVEFVLSREVGVEKPRQERLPLSA